MIQAETAKRLFDGDDEYADDIQEKQAMITIMMVFFCIKGFP